jgi:hypothetical protein
MKIRIDKTARRVGFHKMPIAVTTKKPSAQIGGQIPKTMGQIKKPSISTKPYGGFPKGLVC